MGPNGTILTDSKLQSTAIGMNNITSSVNDRLDEFITASEAIVIINELVDDGLFNNVDDFLSEAINEKLGDMEPITLRDIPYDQQREEIIAYAKSHDDFDAMEVSDELLLDVFEVNDIMVELIKEGILEEL